MSVLVIPIWEVLSPYETMVTKNQYKPLWTGVKLLIVFVLNPEPLLTSTDENTKGSFDVIGDVVVAKNAVSADAVFNKL